MVSVPHICTPDTTLQWHRRLSITREEGAITYQIFLLREISKIKATMPIDFGQPNAEIGRKVANGQLVFLVLPLPLGYDAYAELLISRSRAIIYLSMSMYVTYQGYVGSCILVCGALCYINSMCMHMSNSGQNLVFKYPDTYIVKTISGILV